MCEARYPLITQKRADYELFKKAINCINDKEHITTEGLYKIISIKASMNLGLSDELKVAFPNVISIKRPLVKNQPLPDPQWISGFTCGEGCFKCTIFKSNTNLGESVKLTFQLTQDNRDKQLMKSLGTYLGCGRYEARSKDKNTQVGDFVVTKLSDITEKIIPFFDKYLINGVKHLDYLDCFAGIYISWSQVALRYPTSVE